MEGAATARQLGSCTGPGKAGQGQQMRKLSRGESFERSFVESMEVDRRAEKLWIFLGERDSSI